MEFSTTNKGKPLLLYQGHEYYLHRLNKDGSKAWKCTLARSQKCHGVMATRNDTDIIRGPTEHCHQTDLVKSKAKELRQNMKASVSQQPGVATRQIVARAIANTPEEVLSALPRKGELLRTVRRERNRVDGENPNPRDRNFDIPAEYQPLVLFDSGRQDERRILILGDRDLVQQLDQASEWFVDGTFDAAPEIYCQLYSFHAKVGSNYPPCLYALLPNKDEETYNRLLDAVINQVMVNPNPQRILIDFERAAMNAFRTNFQNAQVRGCYFHLTQCLVRKVGSLGLKQQFDSDMDFKLKIKSLAALSFVPPNDVLAALDDLTLVWPGDDASFELLGYFTHTWVAGIRNRPALFPVEVWNHHDAAAAGGPRTTNACEGWHNSLNSHFLCKHPSIWKLFHGLKEDIALHKLTLAQAQTGIVSARPKKYEVLEGRVQAAVNGYATEPDKVRYLRRLAALQ